MKKTKVIKGTEGKMRAAMIAGLLAAIALFAAGCGGGASGAENAGKGGGDDAIRVISREDGSGTRGAFVELFEVQTVNAEGKKSDATAQSAEITNNTSVMMTTVAGDKNAIGYISLGSLNGTVKALKIDGAAPSVETVKDKSYPVSRPFDIVTKGALKPEAQAFADFIMSKEGQDVVEKSGYIRAGGEKNYAKTSGSGNVVVAGSSSVTPLMERLAEAFAELEPNIEIEIQQSDSTTGVQAALDGICDIGMASRALKDSEKEAGAEELQIATDGLAVIVNNENPAEDLTKDEVKTVYLGEKTRWSELEGVAWQ